MSRLRVRFSKLGKVRFTSHRDVARIWERSLRRAQIPVAYSEGFSPRPKLAFGLALSTGYESWGEYLDVAVREGVDELDPGEVTARLDGGLPVGIDVQAIVPLAAGAASLQQAVTSCTWHIDVGGASPDDVARAREATLAASELPLTRERKGRSTTEDIRPGIVDLRLLDGGDPPGPRGGTTRIEAELATQPRALRPAELVAALSAGRDWPVARVTRINQWTLAGGARQEVIPLPSAATPAPHAEARAS